MKKLHIKKFLAYLLSFAVIFSTSSNMVFSLVHQVKLNNNIFCKYKFEYKKGAIQCTDLKTKKKKVYKKRDKAIQGIDVSKWQGDIDWKKVSNIKNNKTKEKEIEFAIIRDGYGIESPNQIDRYFHKNIKAAQKNGIKCGVYHYSYARDERSAEKEAEFCLKNIRGYKLEYPIMFDIEEANVARLGKRKVTEICRAFCKKIADNGYYPIVYTYLYWVKNYIDSNKIFGEYDLCVARYPVKYSDGSGYECGIWQWTSSGRLNGINGCVDRCVSYYDYSKIIKDYHFNGF